MVVAGLWLGWLAAALFGAVLLSRRALTRSNTEAWEALRAVLTLSGPVNALFGGGLLALAAYSLLASADPHLRLLLAGFALGVGAAPPQAAVALAVRPAFAKIRGADPGAAEMLRQLLPRAALISMPLGTTMMISVAGSKLVAEEHATTTGLIWAILLGLLLALWILQWRLPQHFALPGNVKEFGPRAWASEAQSLAVRMRVRLQKLLLIQTRRTRIAGAFALSGGRIAFTDYLLSALDPDEFLAVTAHELQHFRQAGRTRLTAVACVAFAGAVGTGAAYAAATGVVPDEAALGFSAASVFICAGFLYRMKRRNEDEADDAAIVEVGAVSLMTAIAKTHALNGRLRDGSAGSVHRSLGARLRRIRMQAGLQESAEQAALAAATGLLEPRSQVS